MLGGKQFLIYAEIKSIAGSRHTIKWVNTEMASAWVMSVFRGLVAPSLLIAQHLNVTTAIVFVIIPIG